MPKSKCPICGYAFSYGILGWDSHIARVENHPEYHPKTVVADSRKRAFQRDFPEFFNLAKTAVRRQSGIMARVVQPATKTGTKG